MCQRSGKYNSKTVSFQKSVSITQKRRKINALRRFYYKYEQTVNS